MNQTLEQILSSATPVIKEMDERMANYHKFGLKVLSTLTSENFLDIPLFNRETRFENDGYFYNIPYFHDETIHMIGNTVTLLVIYHVENRSSYCPISIDLIVEPNDSGNDVEKGDAFSIKVNFQGKRTISRSYVYRENGNLFSSFKDYEKLTLNSLINLYNVVDADIINRDIEV